MIKQKHSMIFLIVLNVTSIPAMQNPLEEKLSAFINQTNDNGENALFNTSNPEKIKFLIQAGINVNHKEGVGGRTPLMLYVTGNQFENILPLFIAAKADLNIQDTFGDTVTIRAVMFQNVTALKALIAVGADLSIRNAQNKTALDIAKEIDDKAAIQVLESRSK